MFLVSGVARSLPSAPKAILISASALTRRIESEPVSPSSFALPCALAQPSLALNLLTKLLVFLMASNGYSGDSEETSLDLSYTQRARLCLHLHDVESCQCYGNILL